MHLAALRRTSLALILFACGGIESALAADPPPVQVTTPPGQKAGAGQTPSMPSPAEPHRLPPDSSTAQTLELPGRTLSFVATAGSIRLFDDKGEPQADIAYTAYQLDGADRGSRPVTFFFNGGPGSSSAWLHLGNAGPWRLPINADEVTPSTFPEARPNAETWLDFTDLVFLDPVGTGYSRFVGTGDDARKQLYSVDGDVNALALVVRRWLETHARLLSPKYIVGESYGGIRGPKVVHQLQTQQGIGIKGLIMVSPLFDYSTSVLRYVATLPSYVATLREAEGPVKRSDLADVEAYARSEFLVDLIKGQADNEATTRLADKVAALTGIDQAVSRRLAGRFGRTEFRRELERKNGKLIGNYDASVRGLNPYPDSDSPLSGDPSSDTLLAPLTSATVDLLTRKLNWRPDGSYELLNRAVGRAWDFGRGSPESLSQLRQILATDRKMKLLVAHGLFDLVTPYFASQIVLDQLPPFASAPRLKLVVYPGGHMFYSRDTSRQAFRAEVEAMMK
ncbi:peptidase S10 [Bradyrhizobium yuanmingense]|uniref:S10 family peptidase n=1 Tax=Bradyrhizobium yuanmingense TaxID=108015 RepID=UPI0021A86D12|nr:peptidase S10 [Bradyrhizobium sp. CB1024]UWU83332.1 peptidase S10 [Bradyrhizobium sp. CB1024]